VTQLLLAATCMVSACQGSSSLPGPVVCDVAGSNNACLRCQAQRCAVELDRCHGAGFHEGRSVLNEPVKCVWNSDCGSTLEGYRNGRVQEAGAMDQKLTTTAPCGSVSVCLQACGCGLECARSCQAPPPDGGLVPTTYYSNDPRNSVCPDCVKQHLAPCVRQHCAAECPPT
jgi:hypothetical protein